MLKNKRLKEVVLLLIIFVVISCREEDTPITKIPDGDVISEVELPKRPGPRPETTNGVPHIQIGVEAVPEVNDELYARVYSLPGVEQRPSVVGGWQGIWLTEELAILEPDAIIGGREFGHIHDDGSLHLFLQPARSQQAVDACWAVYHPFALQHPDPWYGFVMLYTPQSLEELDVTFQLIVDGYNYVTGEKIVATDYH